MKKLGILICLITLPAFAKFSVKNLESKCLKTQKSTACRTFFSDQMPERDVQGYVSELKEWLPLREHKCSSLSEQKAKNLFGTQLNCIRLETVHSGQAFNLFLIIATPSGKIKRVLNDL